MARGVKGTGKLHRFALLAGGLLLASAAGLPAQSLTLKLGQDLSYGESVNVQVSLVNPEGTPVTAPDLPAVDGLRITGPGNAAQSSRVEFDGRRTVRQTEYTWTFRIRPAGGKTGEYRIGPATFRLAGGKVLESDAATLTVAKRPKGEGGVAFSVEARPTSGPVKGPFRVIYTLTYPLNSRARSRDVGDQGLRELDFPIVHDKKLIVEPVAADPSRGADEIKTRGLGTLIYQIGRIKKPDGTVLEATTFAFDVIPVEVGAHAIGGAHAVMQRPTGRIVTGRDIFGRPQRQYEMGQFSATVPEATYEAYPLPTQGRPEGFTGAVGQFTITASTQDRRVKTNDPIELVLRVEGDAVRDDLVAPRWDQISALTKDFEVSRDARRGDVEESAVTFRQIVSPKLSSIEQIPPIPFPHFDPFEGEYRIAWSDAIPIEVEEGRTVTEFIPSRNNAERPEASVSTAEEEAAFTQEGGVRGNWSDMGLVTTERNRIASAIDGAFWAACLVPPAIFLLALLWTRRGKTDPVRARQKKALSAARRALESARDNDGLSMAFQDYFRDRLQMPPGEITPVQLESELAERAVDTQLATECRRHLETLLAGRFGGAGTATENLAGESIALVERVDRCKQS